MSAAERIRMSQGYDLLPPKSGQAFPVFCEEWDSLKQQLGKVEHKPWGFHTIGSLLIGAAASPLVTIVAGGIPDPPSNRVIAWAVVATCALCGGLCLYFAAREKDVSKKQVGNILSQMEVIERRYQRSGDPHGEEPDPSAQISARGEGPQAPLAIRSAQYGAGSALLDVTAQLSALVKDGRLRVQINNQLAGDPCPGTVKSLTVEYLHEGNLRRRQVMERAWLELP